MASGELDPKDLLEKIRELVQRAGDPEIVDLAGRVGELEEWDRQTRFRLREVEKKEASLGERLAAAEGRLAQRLNTLTDHNAALEEKLNKLQENCEAGLSHAEEHLEGGIEGWGGRAMKNRKELLKSPVRAWDDTSKEYDAILLVPAGTKHDSGFMRIAVIGVTYRKNKGEEEEYEICGYPDDISCVFPLLTVPGPGDEEHQYAHVRMDCYYPQGIFRYHGPGVFRVGPAVSSTEIFFEERAGK